MCPIFKGCGDKALSLNLTPKKPYKKYEGKTNDVLIAFIGYVSDISKVQQFKLSVQKSHRRISMHFSTLLATVRVALLTSSWRSCFMRAALFIIQATNSSLVFTFSFVDFNFHPSSQTKIGVRSGDFKLQTAVSSHPLKIGHMFI
jgi:hypothetical protein